MKHRFTWLAVGAVVLVCGVVFWPQHASRDDRRSVGLPANPQPTASSPVKTAPPPSPPPGETVVPLRTAALWTSGASYAERVKALKGMGQLDKEEVAALRTLLREHGLVPGLNAPATHGLKDAVMIELENQQPPLADWPEFLITLYEDRAQDAVIRDYALQHLRTWYWLGMREGSTGNLPVPSSDPLDGREGGAESVSTSESQSSLAHVPSGGGSTGNLPVPPGDPPGGREGGTESVSTPESQSGLAHVPSGGSPDGAGGSPALPAQTQRTLARDTFWQALEETDRSIGGTALLALHELSTLDASIDAAAVQAAALSMAGDASNSALCRVTALQVCARLGVSEALPIAEALAHQTDHIPLQISAIAALGQLGGPNELALLEILEPEAPAPLRPAITSALARLNTRLAE